MWCFILTFCIIVWSQVFDHGWVHFLNPSVGSLSWNCTINISREVEHSHLALKTFVDPLRTDLEHFVLEPVITVAHLPTWELVWNVESSSHIRSVQVISDEVTSHAWWSFFESVSLLQLSVSGPWGVVVSSETFFVGFDLAVDDRESHVVWRGTGACLSFI